MSVARKSSPLRPRASAGSRRKDLRAEASIAAKALERPYVRTRAGSEGTYVRTNALAYVRRYVRTVRTYDRAPWRAFAHIRTTYHHLALPIVRTYTHLRVGRQESLAPSVEPRQWQRLPERQPAHRARRTLVGDVARQNELPPGLRLDVVSGRLEVDGQGLEGGRARQQSGVGPKPLQNLDGEGASANVPGMATSCEAWRKQGEPLGRQEVVLQDLACLCVSTGQPITRVRTYLSTYYEAPRMVLM